MTHSAIAAANLNYTPLPYQGEDKQLKAVSFIEIAKRLVHDATKQHNDGDHERAYKSTLIAKELELIAVEKMLAFISRKTLAKPN